MLGEVRVPLLGLVFILYVNQPRGIHPSLYLEILVQDEVAEGRNHWGEKGNRGFVKNPSSAFIIWG